MIQQYKFTKSDRVHLRQFRNATNFTFDFRSGVELFDFIQKNPEYWADFDATRVNVDRSIDGTKLTPQTRKLIKFLELVNSGTTGEEASQLVNNIRFPKPKKPSEEKLHRKDYSKTALTRQTKTRIGHKSKINPQSKIEAKIKIGPKSILATHNGLNRDMIMKLEKRFHEYTCKPTISKMSEWAEEMRVDVNFISDWFNKKWKGKCDYEAMKSINQESDPDRSRSLQKFDPDVVFDAFTDLEDDNEFSIIRENAEDDE